MLLKKPKKCRGHARHLSAGHEKNTLLIQGSKWICLSGPILPVDRSIEYFRMRNWPESWRNHKVADRMCRSIVDAISQHALFLRDDSKRFNRGSLRHLEHNGSILCWSRPGKRHRAAVVATFNIRPKAISMRLPAP